MTVVFIYGNLSAKTEIFNAIHKYTDDFSDINVESGVGCGFKAFIEDEKEISLLAHDIKDYGWIQNEPKYDFEQPIGMGSVIDRGSITSSDAFQDVVTRTCSEPYDLNKLTVTFSGDVHQIQLLLNDNIISEYIVDHLVIDYVNVACTVDDVVKIQAKYLVGAGITLIGFLYGEQS